MNTTNFKKLRSSLRAKLQGMAMVDPKYYKVLEAFEFACLVHNGFRKDNVTPEVYHQLSLLGFAMTQHAMYENPVAIYITILLHDTYEDFDKKAEQFPDLIEQLHEKFPEYMDFIVRISKVVHVKSPDGSYTLIKKEMPVYMLDIGKCIITSVGKGLDRVHNMSTMIGVFKLEKQKSYSDEVDMYFLPMLKEARRNFPNQEPVYEMIKSVLNMLKSQNMHFVEILTGKKEGYDIKIEV